MREVVDPEVLAQCGEVALQVDSAVWTKDEAAVAIALAALGLGEKARVS